FALLALLIPAVVFAELPQPEVDFARDIQPLLSARCVKCHGPDKQENGLRLDSSTALLRGGDNGAALVAGKAAESLLIQAVTGASEIVSKMPLKAAPLDDFQIALLRRWIDSGAKLPAGRSAETAPSKHWAFQQPRR